MRRRGIALIGALLVVACSKDDPSGPAGDGKSKEGSDVALPSPAQPPCSVEVSRVRELTVKAGGQTVRLGLKQGKAQLSPPSDWGKLALEMTEPLSLKGHVEATSVPLRLTDPVVLADGKLKLAPHEALSGLRQSRGKLQARVRLGWFPGRKKEGQQPLDVEPVPITCDSIGASDRDIDARPVRAHTELVSKSKQLGFHFAPKGKRVLTLSAAAERVHVFRRDEKDEWAELELAWESGSRLRGFTPQSQLRPTTSSEALPGSAPAKLDPQSAGGGDLFQQVSELAQAFGAKTERQRSTLAKGASISAAPGGAVWARTTRELKVTVSRQHQAGFAQLLGADGLALGAKPKAWVKVADLER